MLKDFLIENTNIEIFPMLNSEVFKGWKETLERFREDNDHESLELQNLHEQIGAYLIEYLEELEGDLGWISYNK